MLAKVKRAGANASTQAKKAANKAGDAARKFGEERKLGEKLTNVKNATVTATKKATRKGKKVTQQLAKKLKSISGKEGDEDDEEEEEDLPLAYYRVKYAYSPQEDEHDCLFIAPGDRLEVINQPNDQWWYAVTPKGDKGYVPAHCLLPVREKLGHFNYLDSTVDDMPLPSEVTDDEEESKSGGNISVSSMRSNGSGSSSRTLNVHGKKKTQHTSSFPSTTACSCETSSRSSTSSSTSTYRSTSASSASAASRSSTSTSDTPSSSAPSRAHKTKRRLTVYSEDGSVEEGEMDHTPSPSSSPASPGGNITGTLKNLSVYSPVSPPPKTLPRIHHSSSSSLTDSPPLIAQDYFAAASSSSSSSSSSTTSSTSVAASFSNTINNSNNNNSTLLRSSVIPFLNNRSSTLPELSSPPRRKPPPAPQQTLVKDKDKTLSHQQQQQLQLQQAQQQLLQNQTLQQQQIPPKATILRILTNNPILDAHVAENANERFRPTMEDAHVIELDLVPPQPLDMLTSKHNTGYFAVYDGHGGKAAVDLIAQNLHRNLQTELNTALPEAALRQAFLRTDAEMKGKPAYAECGSTVVCALILPSSIQGSTSGRTLIAANAGDARAVLAQVGADGALEAVRLTRDHKPDLYEESVRVAKAGGWIIRGRLDGSLAVSRALGDFNYKERGLTADPDVLSCELDERHLFLILACDGLWDVVKDEEAVSVVRNMDSSRAMAQTLVDLAMDKGTTDNVTVMVVRLQKSAGKRTKTSAR